MAHMLFLAAEDPRIPQRGAHGWGAALENPHRCLVAGLAYYLGSLGLHVYK